MSMLRTFAIDSAMSFLDHGDVAGAQAFLSELRGLGDGDIRQETGGKTFREWARKLYQEFAQDSKRRVQRKLVVPLVGTITTSTTNYEATDSWSAPTTEVAFIEGIRGTLRFNDWSTETLAIATVGNPNVRDRYLIKGCNARIQLQDADDSLDLVASGTNISTLALADILPAVGAKPLEYVVPELVPPGHKLEYTVTLKDQAADVVGGSTEYGILLVCTLVRL